MKIRTLSVVTLGTIPFVYFQTGTLRIALSGLSEPGEWKIALVVSIVVSIAVAAITWFKTEAKGSEGKEAGIFAKILAITILIGFAALSLGVSNGTLEKRKDEKKNKEAIAYQQKTERERKAAAKTAEEVRRASLSPEDRASEDDAKSKAEEDRKKSEAEVKAAEAETKAKAEAERKKWMEREAAEKALELLRGAFAKQIGETVRDGLNDPASVKDVDAIFHPARSEKDAELAICFEFRAKNAFGGYVKNYGAWTLKNGKIQGALGGDRSDSLAAVWNKHCANRSDGFGSKHATANLRLGLGLGMLR